MKINKEWLIKEYQYIVLILILIAQAIAKEHFIIAQVLYFCANMTSALRSIYYKRPSSDIYRDLVLASVSLILLVVNL